MKTDSFMFTAKNIQELFAMMPRLSQNERLWVTGMLESGTSVFATARHLGVPRQTVRVWLCRYQAINLPHKDRPTARHFGVLGQTIGVWLSQ